MCGKQAEKKLCFFAIVKFYRIGSWTAAAPRGPWQSWTGTVEKKSRVFNRVGKNSPNLVTLIETLPIKTQNYLQLIQLIQLIPTAFSAVAKYIETMRTQRPILNFARRGELWTPGVKLSPGVNFVPHGWSNQLGWNSLFTPPFF
jgi:hypothetical protein